MSFEAKATISKGWVGRFLLMGLMFTAFGLWAVYDGGVGYPEKNRAFEAYESLKEQEKLADWPDMATAEGWSQEQPRFYSAWDIRTQFIMAGICIPAGLFFVYHAITGARQTYAADEAAFVTTSGQRIPHEAVTDIDWELWNKKGIAYVDYAHDTGEGRLKIDDVKFINANDVLAIIATQTDIIDETAIRMPWTKKEDETEGDQPATSEPGVPEDDAADEIEPDPVKS